MKYMSVFLFTFWLYYIKNMFFFLISVKWHFLPSIFRNISAFRQTLKLELFNMSLEVLLCLCVHIFSIYELLTCECFISFHCRYATCNFYDIYSQRHKIHFYEWVLIFSFPLLCILLYLLSIEKNKRLVIASGYLPILWLFKAKMKRRRGNSDVKRCCYAINKTK